VAVDEIEVGQHRVDGRGRVEDDHRVLRRHADFLTHRHGALGVDGGLPATDRVESALAAGFDAEEDAQQAQLAELSQRVAVEILRPALHPLNAAMRAACPAWVSADAR